MFNFTKNPRDKALKVSIKKVKRKFKEAIKRGEDYCNINDWTDFSVSSDLEEWLISEGFEVERIPATLIDPSEDVTIYFNCDLRKKALRYAIRNVNKLIKDAIKSGRTSFYIDGCRNFYVTKDLEDWLKTQGYTVLRSSYSHAEDCEIIFGN